jgi:hypothetical protein
VISGFRRDVDEICALLGYNAEERRSHCHFMFDMAVAVAKYSFSDQ